MRSRKVYIIRHGQDWDNANGILNGWRDQPLTPKGEEQAEQIAERLANLGVAAVYSSPLLRAYQTGLAVARRHGLTPIRVDNLIERNFGIMTGKPVSDISKLVPEKNLLRTEGVDYFLEAGGAESFKDLYHRAGGAFWHIWLEHAPRYEDVVIATHGDTGKMIRAWHMNWDWRQGLLTPYFGNANVIVLSQEGLVGSLTNISEMW